MTGTVGVEPGEDDETVFAESAITLWSNLLTMIGLHLRETGTSREELLDMLRMLQETNDETVRSPRARAVATRHLMRSIRS